MHLFNVGEQSQCSWSAHSNHHRLCILRHKGVFPALLWVNNHFCTCKKRMDCLVVVCRTATPQQNELQSLVRLSLSGYTKYLQGAVSHCRHLTCWLPYVQALCEMTRNFWKQATLRLKLKSGKQICLSPSILVLQVGIICCDRKWLVMIEITRWLILRDHIISLLSDHLNCSVMAYLISFIVNSTYSLFSFFFPPETQWVPHHSSNDFFLSLNSFLLQAEVSKIVTSVHSSDLQEGEPISDLLLALLGRHGTKGALERVWTGFLLKRNKGSVLGVSTSWLLAHR